MSLGSENTVLIKSSDRESYSTGSHDFTIQAEFLLDGLYRVVSVLIPNSVYSVRTGINDKVYFTYGAAARTATIPPGDYTGTTIASNLASVMNAEIDGSDPFSVVYSAVTGKLTVSSSGSNFGFAFGTNTAASARKVIGFNAANQTEAASKVSDNKIDVSGINLIFLRVGKGSSTIKSLTGASVHGSIYLPLAVSSGYFSLLTSNDIPQVVRFEREKNIKISLHDEDNNTADLNGVEWVLVLQRITDFK